VFEGRQPWKNIPIRFQKENPVNPFEFPGPKRSMKGSNLVNVIQVLPHVDALNQPKGFHMDGNLGYKPNGF